MTTEAVLSASCRALDNADSKGPAGPLFVLVHWHEGGRVFDIWLTDCKHAWSVTGCTVAYQAMDADAAWKRAKEALADEAAAATQYNYSARQPPRGPEQQLELTWSWQRSNSHVREMMRVTPPLKQQQDSSTVIRLIMTHVMSSYSVMKAAMDESRKAQLLLERSLSDMQQQLQQKTQEWQGKEQALFTKFAMLLNKKSERIQALTDALQQQARQLEQLQGEEDHNTDDEALAAAYGAETEDDEPDEPAQLQEQHDNQQQQPQQLLPLVKQEQLLNSQQPLQQVQKLGPASGAAPKLEPDQPAAAAAKPVDAMDLDQATQLLDEEAQAALELQRQQYLQQQQQQRQQAGGSLPGPAAAQAAQGLTEGVGGAAAPAAPAAPAALDAGGSSVAAAALQQQQQQDGPAEAAQRKPKAFKRRR